MSVTMRSSDPSAAPHLDALVARLKLFYTTTTSYFDNAETTSKSRFYEAFLPILESLIEEQGHISVLEFGVGRTRFPNWLTSKGLRQSISFVAQDISSLDRDWLDEVSDEVLIGDVADCVEPEKYDLVFSTFVYEHLVFPESVVQACFAGLRPRGVLILFSPNYTMLGYIPPALRHLTKPKQLITHLRLVVSAQLSKLMRRPNYWIVTDPALFFGSYFRDADAVHMVSRNDIVLTLPREAQRLPLNIPAASLRDWIYTRFMLLAVAYRKP